MLLAVEWPLVSAQPLRLLGVGDGRSINVLRWARRLLERGHEVHLASDRIAPEAERPAGLSVYDVRELRLATRVPGVRRHAIAPAIGALARRLGVDLVHAHYLLPYGWWAARAGCHPLVVSPWSRDVFVDAAERRRGRRRSLEAIRVSDFLVVNSRANERASVELGADPERIREIIWYSELDRFAPGRRDPELRRRRGWPEDALVVLSLRNYRPYTNLDVVLRAFARVAREEPRARLVLAARGGPTRGELEALAGELGIRPLVSFERVEWEDLPGVAAASDVAVTIADSDSTPASLLEVMASRIPVVAGRTWSIDEWIEPGEGGALVECRDEDAVTEALRRLLADPELRRRHGERNERVVRERLGDPGEQLDTLYRELLAR
jgi:glycosyltransferase involved in cell wall biosynthesis